MHFGDIYHSDELLKILNRFYKRKEMQKLAADQGLDGEEMKLNHLLTHFLHSLLIQNVSLFF